ncbi:MULTISPECIES: transposase [Streptomyces]|uniref:transposase n=1 Tax=Streptomyces TaxID=1883 RepID=UPI00339EEEED
MPTGYTWSRTGQRAVVPREDTKGRRVNVLGALITGTAPDLVWEHTPGKIDAAVLLEFVCSKLAGLPGGAAALSLAADGTGTALPVWRRSRPCTVVLDNASAHVAKAFKSRRDQLAKIGVDLFYLPPRSPELNDIEHIWRSAKYEDYPQRAHTSIEAIAAAVDNALTRQQTRIRRSTENFTKAA